MIKLNDRLIKKFTISEDGEVLSNKVVTFYNPFKEGKGYNFKYKSICIKSYLESEFPECFSDVEVGRLYRLSKHIYSNSNLLAKRTTDNLIKPLSKIDIQDIVNIHRTNFVRFFKKVMDNKVIKAIEMNGENFYCFNPMYFNSSTYLPLYVFIAFQEELKEHLPLWVVQRYLDMQENLNKTEDSNL